MEVVGAGDMEEGSRRSQFSSGSMYLINSLSHPGRSQALITAFRGGEAQSSGGCWNCLGATVQHGGVQDSLLQEMGQRRFPAPLKAGQQWNAVLSTEPFSAWTIPGEAQGKSFAEEGWGRI